MAKLESFRFRRLDVIGTPDALQDHDFLQSCFVDTGLVEVLMDCRDPRRIVVGRTGSGKTALLQRMRDSAENVIVLQPEQLALGYIANSNILQFVIGLGVKLDIFYRLLWRHVLVVEFLRRQSSLDSELSTRNLIQTLTNRFKLQRRQSARRALDYLQKFGGTFWEDTDHRIKEVTTKVEDEIKASFGAELAGSLALGVNGGQSLSTEQRIEVSQRAQSVVNTIQARELAEMIELLDVILDDPQQQFYILIDRLDEDWVDDRLRYGLIRALLETVREFHKVRHAKVVVALRADLVDRVFKNTRDAGFQQEKYEGELVRLSWTRDTLLAMLSARVNHLVKRSYTRGPVTYKDVLPKRIGDTETADFLVDRTLMRPRDLIQFFNACIRHADGKPQISENAVRSAEGEYSRDRLAALADEWFADYPNFMSVSLPLLKNRPAQFSVGTVTADVISDFCLTRVTSQPFQHDDPISRSTLAVAEGRMTPLEYWLECVEMFYRVGIVGLRIDRGQPLMWSCAGGDRRSVSTAEISVDTRMVIHPCFRRVLGTDRPQFATPES